MMTTREEHVMLPAADADLEGRFVSGTAPGGAVITHPHPLYGGTMDNNVVWTAARAFQARGQATLRFNFRGVGFSSGSYGEGLAEVADIQAALAYLREHADPPYWLVGYSFGAAVAARALLAGLAATGGVLISPPIAFMTLDFLPDTPRLQLVICGDRDDLCPLADLKVRLAPAREPVALAVLPGADHFYGGREADLFQLLRDHECLRSPA